MPNKERLETEAAEKKKEAVEKSKRKLVPSKPKKAKKKFASSSSESDTNVTLHNSSSDLDMLFSELEQDDKEDNDGPPLLQEGDFVVVKIQGKTKDSFRFYVFKVCLLYTSRCV